jgi:deoxyribodipyrimidine photo-lyase
VDAAPYFRVFNPELQAKKFDPEGRYQSTWLPSGALPPPLVDLARSREGALASYQQFVRTPPFPA